MCGHSSDIFLIELTGLFLSISARSLKQRFSGILLRDSEITKRRYSPHPGRPYLLSQVGLPPSVVTSVGLT